MTKEELIKTLEEYDKEVNRLFKENKKLKKNIDKAIEYIGNGNLETPRKTREKFIKILKGE